MSYSDQSLKRPATVSSDESQSVGNKRQRTESDCTEEPHRCAGHPYGKTKWFAIWGGPNPGVHFSDWATVVPWAQGVGAVKQKGFGDKDSAWSYYTEQKKKFPAMGSQFRQSSQQTLDQQQVRDSLAVVQDSQRVHHEQRLSNHRAQSNAATYRGSHNIAFDPGSRLSHTFDPSESSPPIWQPRERFPPPPPDHEADFIPLDQDTIFPAASIPHFSQDINGGSVMPTQHGDEGRAARGPTLCEEQANLVDLIVNGGKNVFYTGSAGVGKSTVLKVFRRELAAKGLKVNVIAPTGRAALDINGQTTWSYAGWIPSSMAKPLAQLCSDAWAQQVRKRLRRTDVLVIDEISMVDNHHFQRLNEIMKAVRQNEKPFGGVQLVVTGDFCQLPPVKPFEHCIQCGTKLTKVRGQLLYKAKAGEQCTHIYCDEDKWAFRSQAWKDCNLVHVNLKQIHRQNDRTFIQILQKLRLGETLHPDELDLLRDHECDTDKAVRLFPTREEVKVVNDREFARLTTPAHIYDCVDNFEQRNPAHNLSPYRNRAVDGTLEKLKDHRYERQVSIKEGMLVVLLANLNIQAGLVNGSQGTVIGYEPFYSPEQEQQLDDKKKLELIQDTLNGEHTHYRAQRIHEFMQDAPTKMWPVVRFLNGAEVTIKAECSCTELGDEPPKNPRYSLVSRTQIPLMAAWAMTIHKSQGMTLNRVEVDLGRNFEEGMAYVALSRARNLEGLRVVSFPDTAQMRCNEEVREFLDEQFEIEKMLNPAEE